ncbi:MAG: site-specific DNA-methyltransferase [Acidobacteriota bacterium]|nr:site-specific DNA-methyltransferase [Acidobacteriota bacterium]
MVSLRPFVSPSLVRDYLQRFGVGEGQRVLDPFCGTGTTVVESKKLGIASVGIEANAMAHFAGTVKVDWTPSPEGLSEHAQRAAASALARPDAEGMSDTDDDKSLRFYSFRYRVALPESIRAKASDGKQWIIRPAVRSRYCFVVAAEQNIAPTAMKAETKSPTRRRA